MTDKIFMTCDGMADCNEDHGCSFLGGYCHNTSRPDRWKNFRNSDNLEVSIMHELHDRFSTKDFGSSDFYARHLFKDLCGLFADEKNPQAAATNILNKIAVRAQNEMHMKDIPENSVRFSTQEIGFILFMIEFCGK